MIMEFSFWKPVDCHIKLTLVTMWYFYFWLASINGDGAAQPVPSTAEQPESSSSDQTNDSDGASWPAPFEMPSSVSEDPSASSQVS